MQDKSRDFYCIFFNYFRICTFSHLQAYCVKMGKEKHNFCEFFYLCSPNNSKANKKAVCLLCIKKHILSIATTKPECFVSNKALLCCNYLKNVKILLQNMMKMRDNKFFHVKYINTSIY